MRFVFLGLFLFPCLALAELIPADTRQLIVSIAPDGDSSKGVLYRFEREGKNWVAVGTPMPALFGKNGLAWGRGLLAVPETGLHKHKQKRERDGRAPAGAFRIGKIYTYDAALPQGSDYPFLQVNEADAWVDDPANPLYNQHVRVDLTNPPAWFQAQKMRHGDFAYRWLVEIRHNSEPPVAGEGSAIFFHIRRGESRPTSGCTTLASEDLVTLIRWLRAPQRPVYVLLTQEDYQERWKTWGLPDPTLLR